MKKLMVVIVVGVALLLLIIPGVVGMQMEEQYKLMVGEVEKQGLKVVRSDYQRGWFGATAETELTIPVPESPVQGEEVTPPNFTLMHEISHGSLEHPMGLTIDTGILMNGEPLFPSEYPAVIQTRIGFDGAGETIIDLPAYEAEEEGLKFQGAKGAFQFSGGYDHVTVNIDMPAMEVNEKDKPAFVLTGLAVNSRASRSESGLMLSEGVFTVERISVQDKEGRPQMDMSGLGVDMDMSEAKNLVAGTVSYTLDSLEVDGEHFGPGHLGLKMDNLSASALAKLQQGMEEINAQHLPPEQQGMAVLGVMMTNGPELLAADPRLSIEKLQLVTPQGEIDGRFQIQPVGLEWSEVSDLGAALTKLQADAELRMPETLIKALFAQQARKSMLNQIRQQRLLGEEVEEPDPAQLESYAAKMAEHQLEGLLKQGILVQKGETIEIAAVMRDGQLSVNGNPIPLPVPVSPSP